MLSLIETLNRYHFNIQERKFTALTFITLRKFCDNRKTNQSACSKLQTELIVHVTTFLTPLIAHGYAACGFQREDKHFSLNT